MSDFFDKPKFETPEAAYGILTELLGDKNDLQRFLNFISKEKQKGIRKQLEGEVSTLTSTILKKEFDKAEEQVNKVMRTAWAMACEKMGYDEAEFPCRW